MIAIRNIIRHKLYSFINITGLAIGIAVCLLVFLFVRDEVSYDRFHSNSDRIYKVIREVGEGNELEGVTPLPLCEALKTDFPEIEVLQTRKKNSCVINYKENTFTEEGFCYTDPNFFKVFSFHLIKGDPNTALKNPKSVVITKDITKKYFGTEDPMGKTLLFENEDLLVVTGVMENIPENSHVQFDFLSAKSDYIKDWMKSWNPNMFFTYILFPKNYSVETFAGKLPAFLEKYIRKDATIAKSLKLQRLSDIYLHSSDIKFNHLGKQGDIKELYIFSIIAVFILILASINYMNLTTSLYSNRMNEIGVRKVIGARRNQLIKQFLGESILTCLSAVLLSLFLVELFLPEFNSLMGKELKLEVFKNINLMISIIMLGFILGLISGSYPAVFLSSFNPTKILKGSANPISKKIMLRKILIVVQYTIAVTFIVSVSIGSLQINFMKNKNLGFNKANLVSIDIPWELRSKFDVYRNDVLKNKEVINMALAGGIPPHRLGTTHVIKFFVNGEEKKLWTHVMYVDYDFIETLGLKVKQGRSFSREFGSNEKESLIFNEAAIKAVGLKNIIGEEVNHFDQKKKVIGVVEDFNYWTLHEKIEPVVIVLDYKGGNILARISPGNVIERINILKSKWEETFPDWPFEFTFVDDNINKLYSKEVKMEKLAQYLTILAIITASLGLFGLSAFSAQKRTKEIGIRKVLGASIPNIVKLVSGEFLILVCIANIIAYPVTYYFMNKWLEDFAYRIDISLWMFILSGGIALLIAFATVSFQAIKAATANPVEALKHE
jgi:putative ABC transport system permease protein